MFMIRQQNANSLAELRQVIFKYRNADADGASGIYS